MNRDDKKLATELARYLPAGIFPARRPTLIFEASTNHAPEDILIALRQLPGEDTYVSPEHVWAALESAKQHQTLNRAG